MDDIQQTHLTPNGSDLLLTAYPDFFRKANSENNSNIVMLIIVIIFEFLMIFGLYFMKKKKKSRQDDQFWMRPIISRDTMYYKSLKIL